MHRNSRNTGLIITILLAALALPGWMLAQSLSIIPSDTRTISGESSILKARSADSQYGPNRQDPSAADAGELIQSSMTTVDSFNPMMVLTTDPFETNAATTATEQTTMQTKTAALATTSTDPLTTDAPAAKTTTPTTSTMSVSKPTVTTAKPTTTAAKPTTSTAKATTTTVPATSVTTAPPTVNTSSVDYWRSEILRLTNEERSKAGKPALKAASTALSNAAKVRAIEVCKVFEQTGALSHDRPDRPADDNSCFTVLSEYGISYRTAGENIAYCTAGSRTPAYVVGEWMASTKGHKENILNAAFTSLGVGYYRANGRDYFVQLFIG